jgi:hypothetical protein
MKLGTHMPDGERRKPIDIEVSSDNVLVKRYQITVLFLEIVILTFNPQTSSS